MARKMRIQALGLLVPVVVGVVGLVWLVGGGSSSGHRLFATVPEATNVVAGQELKAGGRAIGRIESIEAVDRGHRAKLTLEIDDDAWPLPRGTKFTVRWGGTATLYNRHVLVTPGPQNAPPMGEGSQIPARDVTVPVEVDQLLSNFTPGVRRELKSFVDVSGVTLDRSQEELEGVLEETPPALEQAAFVMRDLVADRGALSATVRHTDSVVDAVHRADPGLSSLLTSAATTFDAIADEQQDLRITLERLPATLQQLQATLGRADSTLRDTGSLARRLGPGVRELRAIAQPANRVLAALQEVGPDAETTLRTVREAAPDVNGLLARLTRISPQLGSIGDKAVENLQCIRPWTPEITGLLTTWADFMSWNDGRDKILRAQIQNFLPANYNNVPLTPAQAAQQFPDIRYGFPRPPGYNAGQVWYQPECGAGPEAVDPSEDQEAEATASGGDGR